MSIFGDKSQLEVLMEQMAEVMPEVERSQKDEILRGLKRNNEHTTGMDVALFFFAYQRALRSMGTYTIEIGYRMGFKFLAALGNIYWDINLDANQHSAWICRVVAQAGKVIREALEQEEQA
jgi:hypothetical protein